MCVVVFVAGDGGAASAVGAREEKTLLLVPHSVVCYRRTQPILLLFTLFSVCKRVPEREDVAVVAVPNRVALAALVHGDGGGGVRRYRGEPFAHTQYNLGASVK